MQKGTKQKSNDLRSHLRGLPLDHTLQIHMSEQKQVHWLVPLPIEFLVCMRIPPILVKFPVVQFGYLCEEIAHRVENQVETGQEKYEDWQHQPQHQLYRCYLVGFVDPGLDEL